VWTSTLFSSECKSLRLDAPDIVRRSLHGNPASRAIPPRPVSSNVSCRMLHLSRSAVIVKPNLPSPSCLRFFTSLLPMTLHYLRTPSPTFPPPCSLPDRPHTQACLLSTSQSPGIYFLVRQTFPDSLPLGSLPSDLIVYPHVSGECTPTLSLLTLLLP